MVNNQILIGNLGGDPELRYTKNQSAVCNFSIATSEKWKDSNGEQQEETNWHRIVVWGKQAEACEKYLSKGSQVYVEGTTKHRKWEDDDGNQRVTTEVHARNVRFLTSRNTEPSEGGGGDSSEGLPF